MRKYTIVKYCRTCEGKGSVVQELRIDGNVQETVLLCPHCKGKGHHVWGYVADTDLGEAEFIVGADDE